MSAIKPGCLCLIVGNDVDERCLGKAVTAIAYRICIPVHDRFGKRGYADAWDVDAPWYPTPMAVPAANLLPIGDPRIDLTEQTDDESILQDNLLEALTLARSA